jgi:hypothetical protein
MKNAITVITIRVGGTPAARRKVQEQIENALERGLIDLEVPKTGFGGVETTVHQEAAL